MVGLPYCIHQDWAQGENGYKAARDSYNEIHRSHGIDWAKGTHLRKSGMDRVGSLGVANEALGSMSKHTSQDKQTRYNPELRREVCSVTSGHEPDEAYFVPRMGVPLPNNMTFEAVIATMFPRYAVWLYQVDGLPSGDHSKAARNFVKYTLPYLALVAIQDGIYWVNKFPTHEISLLLKNLFPNYEIWAAQQRQYVQQLEIGATERRIAALNDAAIAGFQHAAAVTQQLQARTQHLEIGMQMNTSLMRQMLTMLQHQSVLLRRLAPHNNQRPLQPAPLQQQPPPPPPPPPPPAPFTPVSPLGSSQVLRSDVAPDGAGPRWPRVP